jgi:hypothetical protein
MDKNSIGEELKAALTVNYIHEQPGFSCGNIMWKPAHPMRHGKFPSSHPASPNCGFGLSEQMGKSEKMEAFRQRGYWASCFPEGDGITMKVRNGQSPEQVRRDIEEVFGWKVK